MRFNVSNLGEDAHNLQVRGPHGYRSSVTPDIGSGRDFTLTAHLRRPRRLHAHSAPKPGHAAKGMKGLATPLISCRVPQECPNRDLPR